jgi:hypothetical protein
MGIHNVMESDVRGYGGNGINDTLRASPSITVDAHKKCDRGMHVCVATPNELAPAVISIYSTLTTLPDVLMIPAMI